MKRITSLKIALVVSLFTVLSTASTQAATLRAYVSSTGNDANAATNCAQTAPCRTFAGAYPTVTPGGELIALDTSGYGPLNITKAITIATVPGATAFVVAASGTVGITVSAGTTDLVRLQNINFNGSGAANTTGLRHNSGRLVVKNCTFQQLTTGVDNFAKMDLIECDLHGNGTAVLSTGTGHDYPGNGGLSGPTQVRIDGGRITFNTVGLHQNTPNQNVNGSALANIWLLTFGNVSHINMGGNTTGFTCTGFNCSPQPATYSWLNSLK